jgi:hypothetical protein
LCRRRCDRPRSPPRGRAALNEEGRPNPLGRPSRGALGAAILVLLLAGPAAGSGPPRLQPPSIFDAGLVAPRVNDRILQSRNPLPTHVWGGGFATSAGEPVNLWISDAYPEDRAVGQQWVDFLGQLVHGPELSRATVYLAKPDEVEYQCGYGAIACYQPLNETIMAPAEDIPGTISAEGALTHEYGHHVSQNRVNPPWDAGNYGTKRWATQLGVCAAVARHHLFPGDQAEHYRHNPSEIFAESYRVLNERRLGRLESAWRIVDDRYYPDEAALHALERDVLDPWRENTAVNRTVSASRSVTVSTPLDGSIDVVLTGPRSALALADPSGKVLTRSAAGKLHARVCGQRSLTVQVTGPKRGAFSLRISRP